MPPANAIPQMTFVADVVIIPIFCMACSMGKVAAVVLTANSRTATPQVEAEHGNTKRIIVHSIIYGKTADFSPEGSSR